MIHVVIPVHNRKEYTRGCLISLLQQDQKNFDICVIDDGSSDGTSEMIQEEFPEITLLKGDGNLWWAGSMNKGIRHILEFCQPNDYILTLNDDVILSPDYISNLKKAANNYPDAIIGSVETTIDAPNIIKNGGTIIDWMTAKVSIMNRGKNLDEFPRGYTIEVSEVTGRGSLFPSQVFREVGLYDENHIKQCADTELSIKANLKHGFPLRITYDAIVISHLGNKSDVNTKKFFTLSDARDYFFSIKSHYNLINRYWISRSIAPNKSWFLRYLSLNLIRTILHFIIHLRFRTGQ